MASALTRQALVFSGPGQVDIVDETLPPPAAGCLRARTLVSAISSGTELLALRGELPPELPVDENLGGLGGQTFKYPFRYGYAQVGTVDAVGEGVEGARWMGRRIFAFAPHASAFTVGCGDAVLVPDDIEPDRAALLAHMETAVTLLLDGRPLVGEDVLVIGLGTVGLLTTALLARFPLRRLAAVDRDASRAEAAASCHRNLVTPAATASAVVAALGARGADIVFELSGNPEALELATAAAAHEGTIVLGSWYGNKRANVDLGGRFHRRRLRLISSQVSHLPAALSARWDRERRFDTAWSALRVLDLSPLGIERLPFRDAGRAYEALHAGTSRHIHLVHDKSSTIT